MNEAGLTLHPEKTRVVDATPPGGFDFLGCHFERGHRWPREKSLKKLKDRLREQTPRLAGRSLKHIITGVNRTLRGWYEYFQHSVAHEFPPVDSFCATALAEPAGKAARPHPARAGSGATPLAERMVGPPWAAESESRTRVDADHRTTTNPLTGEPDAGNPPVRFGGRGKVQSLVPASICVSATRPGSFNLR